MSMLHRWVLALGLAAALGHAAPKPADWVPARWSWNDPQSLDLLRGSPVNCLLLRDAPAGFVAEARARGIVTLAILAPGGDTAEAARKALAAKVDGIVLDGDFSGAAVAAARQAAGEAPVVELAARSRMKLGSAAPILGTYQGVWPGISLQEDGGKKAG